MHDSSTAPATNEPRWGHRLASDDPGLDDLDIPVALPSTRWILQRDPLGHLQILDQSKPRRRPLMLELGSAELQRRIAGGRQQPLARACGLHKGGEPKIQDLTAGLCRDAWCLAALGAHMTVWERHPLLFALMRDALALANTPVSARIQPRHADACAATSLVGDVLFLDPMFPSAGKRAAPGLEMQIMQELVGADADAEALLQTALTSGVSRVVLKRPPRGSKVRLGKPDISFGGGRVVYDVYINR